MRYRRSYRRPHKSRFVEMFGDLAICEKWQEIKLIEACQNKDDIKCGPFGTQLCKDEYRDSGVAVWEIPQINTQCQIFPDRFVSNEKARELAEYTVEPGDIVMSRKGNVGKCAIFPSIWPVGIIHSDVLRIRVDRNICEPVFMMSQLHYNRDVQWQINLVSNGAVMAGVNVTKLKNVKVKIPPLPLQREFTAFVAKVDKLAFTVRESLESAEKLYRQQLSEAFS